jgi:hypothetical protein
MMVVLHQFSLKWFPNQTLNHPSGKQFDTAFLTAIADKMKAINGYFVIDEAYLDYGMFEYAVSFQQYSLIHPTLSRQFQTPLIMCAFLKCLR